MLLSATYYSLSSLYLKLLLYPERLMSFHTAAEFCAILKIKNCLNYSRESAFLFVKSNLCIISLSLFTYFKDDPLHNSEESCLSSYMPKSYNEFLYELNHFYTIKSNFGLKA